MYKTFELFYKSLYIIAFWSVIFFILETRKINESFLDVATSTLLGWCLFFIVFSLFTLFISSSFHLETEKNKKSITGGVVEDGMKFSVGGHIKFLDLLPPSLSIESNILNDYSNKIPNEQKIRDAQKQSLAINELLTHEEDLSFSEKETFLKNEGDGANIYVNEVTETPLQALTDEEVVNKMLSGFEGQSKEDIEREANEVVQVETLSDLDKSRSITKGILFYQYQFNALLSYVVNKKIDEFNKDIKKNKIKVNGKVISSAERDKRLAVLVDEAAELKAKIEVTIKQVLDTLPKFTYSGIVSTTPAIKPRKQLDLKHYQLVIFTALFPYISWFDLRSHRSLNTIDPEKIKDFMENLTEEEKLKLNKKELGLSLRDKRVLWSARKMYDVYLNRDKDIVEKGFSPFNMPISIDENGEMYNPLEETVALCELLRQALNTQPVALEKPKPRVKYHVLNDMDIMGLVTSIFYEKNRFIQTQTQDRIGLIRDGYIYLDMDSFIPKFNGRLSQRFPHYANLKDYNEAIFNFYKRLVNMNLLAMRELRPSDSHIEIYDFKTNGELFTIRWDYPKGATVTIKNTLIIHAAQLFHDLQQQFQDTVATPTFEGVSEFFAIPNSQHMLIVKDAIQKREELEKQQKALDATVKKDADKQNQRGTENANDFDGMNANSEEPTTEPKNTTPSNPKNTNSGVTGGANGKGLELDVTPDIEQYIESNPQALLEVNQGAINQEKYNIIDADKNINLQHQVLSLHKIEKKDRNNPQDSSRVFVIYKKKQKELFTLKYDRGRVDEYAKTIDLTIIKLLHSIHKGMSVGLPLRNINKLPNSSSRGIAIDGNHIHKIFDLYEQMAMFSKKGSSNLWRVSKQEFINNADDKFGETYDQIAVIECVQITDTQEEYLVKKLKNDLWDAKKAKALFQMLSHKLIEIEPQHSRLKINYDRQGAFFIMPKRNLGRLHRVGLEINSFLTYVNQYSDEIPQDMQRFANALDSIIIKEEPYIKVNLIEG
ncbi:hypothetical protein [Acinetobacter sp. P1(2025)]|uniref:hypothetical protein n=1 Tax=Acinetobacter sp. P1(2025) TaxID=3446120 RepID=UPI003F52D24F